MSLEPSPQDTLRALEGPSLSAVCMMLGEVKAGIRMLLEQDKEQDNKIAEHEARLGVLEKWQARVFGVWGAISVAFAVGGFLLNHFWK